MHVDLDRSSASGRCKYFQKILSGKSKSGPDEAAKARSRQSLKNLEHSERTGGQLHATVTDGILTILINDNTTFSATATVFYWDLNSRCRCRDRYGPFVLAGGRCAAQATRRRKARHASRSTGRAAHDAGSAGHNMPGD